MGRCVDSNKVSGEAAENSAEGGEKPEREVGLAGARGPPRAEALHGAEARHGVGTATQVYKPDTYDGRKAFPEAGCSAEFEKRGGQEWLRLAD